MKNETFLPLVPCMLVVDKCTAAETAMANEWIFDFELTQIVNELTHFSVTGRVTTGIAGEPAGAGALGLPGPPSTPGSPAESTAILF